MLHSPPRVGTPWRHSSLAAVANGATVRGEPGVWTQYSERYYAAFVNDLHQNNVEAVWHAPEPVVDAPRRHGVP